MSDAARYWGVPIPIARRDRKSGAKKRKQEEIEASRLVTAGNKYGQRDRRKISKSL
jgi:DNA (cytosine-5)-methyltransferase 1